MTLPTDYNHWCEHYHYDPKSAQAQTDYAEYRRQAELFSRLIQQPAAESHEPVP